MDRVRARVSLAAGPPLTSCVATLDEMPAAPGEPADPRGKESSRLPAWSTPSDSATLGRRQGAPCHRLVTGCQRATTSSPRPHHAKPRGPRG